MLIRIKVAIAMICVQAALSKTWVMYDLAVLIGLKVILMPLWQLL